MSYLFGSDRPQVDTRYQSTGILTATPGESTHYFVIPFDLMLNGLHFYAWNSNKGDHVTIEMQYQYNEEWKLYQKYSKDWIVIPNTNIIINTPPTRPLDGMRIAIKYHNTGEVNIDFAINLLTYVDEVSIDISSGESGVNW